MVLTRRQPKIFITQFNELFINQKFQMSAPVNYVIGPFEGKKNP